MSSCPSEVSLVTREWSLEPVKQRAFLFWSTATCYATHAATSSLEKGFLIPHTEAGRDCNGIAKDISAVFVRGALNWHSPRQSG